MLELGSHGPAAHHEIGQLARQLHVAVVALGELAGAIAESAGGELAGSPAEAGRNTPSHAPGPATGSSSRRSRGMRLERVLEAMKQVIWMLFHLLYGGLGDRIGWLRVFRYTSTRILAAANHGAAPVVRDRPVVHRAAQVAPDRRDHPRRRPGDPQ